jgi:tetratricopeptide (TPR) repeat protein
MRLPVIVSFLVVASVNPIMAQNAYVSLGRRAFFDRDFKLAATQLEKAYLVDSTNTNALFMLGYSYYQSQNYAKSIATFNRELVVAPNETQAYYYRARAKTYLGKDFGLTPAEREKHLLGAIWDYTHAITLSPKDEKINSFYQNRGIAYREYGIFKAQANLPTYNKARAIQALKASIEELEKILASEPHRNDIVTQLDLSKEKLAGVVGHH